MFSHTLNSSLSQWIKSTPLPLPKNGMMPKQLQNQPETHTHTPLLNREPSTSTSNGLTSPRTAGLCAVTCSRPSYCGLPTHAFDSGSLPSGPRVSPGSWLARWQHSGLGEQSWLCDRRSGRGWGWTLSSSSSVLQRRWPFHWCPLFLPSRDSGEAIQLTPWALGGGGNHIRSDSHTWLCINAWHRSR